MIVKTQKLSYDDFHKAVDAGFSLGACACRGPEIGDIWCSCQMQILDMLTPEGRQKLENEWIMEELHEEEKRLNLN